MDQAKATAVSSRLTAPLRDLLTRTKLNNEAHVTQLVKAGATSISTLHDMYGLELSQLTAALPSFSIIELGRLKMALAAVPAEDAEEWQ